MLEEKCERHDCIMVGEISHINNTLKEFKENAEKQTDKMLEMRDSKLKTEWSLEAIQKKQETDAKTSKDNYDALLIAVEAMKNEKSNTWKQLGLVAKIALVTAIVTWFAGNILGLLKVFAPKVIGL